MEDGAVFPNVVGSNPSMEFDFMDELLFEGCWLEADDELNPSPSTPCNMLNSTSCDDLVACGKSADQLNPTPPRKSQLETQSLDFSTNPLSDPSLIEEESIGPQSQDHKALQISTLGEGSTDPSQGWWIGPATDPGPSSSVRERLMMAISYIKGSARGRNALIQIWVPVKKGGKHVLTTDNQPFSIDPNSQSLANYRNVSKKYHFPADEDSTESAGLPGRVFLGRMPEWTPDVRFFRSDEYPRISYAWRYQVCGSLALPIFEHSSGTCLGVLEVVTTSQKMKYRLELENVCKALEAVNLRSSQISIPPSVKDCNKSYKAATPEIAETLKILCKMHDLPLAQTWAPCIQQGKTGCWHSGKNNGHCLSTVDLASSAADRRVLGFHEACSEHHLLSHQGIVGRASTTNQLCFETDIAAYGKTEYPLSHHARMIGLRAAVAIRLRSIYTTSENFILEFFLPPACQDVEEQNQKLNSLSVFLHQASWGLRAITDQELDEEPMPVGEFAVSPLGRFNSKEIVPAAPSKDPSSEESSWITQIMEAQHKENGASVALLQMEFKITTSPDKAAVELHQAQAYDSSHKSSADQELEEEPMPVGEFSVSPLGRFNSKEIVKIVPAAPSKGPSSEESSWIAQMIEAQHKENGASVALPQMEFKITASQDKAAMELHRAQAYDSRPKSSAAGGLGSSFGAHSSLGVRKSDKKRQSKMEKTISLQVLQQYFAGSLKDAAKSIGVCPTTLKRICRQHGINRWPSRKIKKVDHSLRKLQLVIDSVQGVDGGVKIGSFYKSFPELSSTSPTGGNTFSTLKMTKQLKQIDSEPQPQPECGPSTHGATTRSPSSSCSHSSSSSYCCSTVAKQHSFMVNAPSSGDIVTAENPGMVLKRGSNDAELQVEGLPPLRKSSGQDLRNGGAFKVKANFGEEKIRFSLQENRSFEDLQQEIASHFCLDDTGKIDLKYLDDDSEWVLLTCDADLEECIDLHKSARNRTIRLSLHQASHLHSRSLGSTCPS